jgi:hypothetical protein
MSPACVTVLFYTNLDDSVSSVIIHCLAITDLDTVLELRKAVTQRCRALSNQERQSKNSKKGTERYAKGLHFAANNQTETTLYNLSTKDVRGGK